MILQVGSLQRILDRLKFYFLQIGEVLECLPPGKSYRRKRYNSFDANQVLESGNEENVAPPGGTGTRCELAPAVMKSRENGLQEPEEEEPQVQDLYRFRFTKFAIGSRLGPP